MSHVISVDLTPSQFGGKQSITVENNYFMFDFYGDEMFINISKPNQVKLDTLDVYELTSPIPSNFMMIGQQRKRKNTSDDVPVEEWQKLLALAPNDIVTKTLQNTT